ncbi:hypothetical protein Tco_0958081, partial [Tanacetum coccineum]
ESKRKLEELLQKWSDWHARHNSKDSMAELESGEGTYFPALSPSAVSFWIDGQTRSTQSNEAITLDNSSVPLYDRGWEVAYNASVLDPETRKLLGLARRSIPPPWPLNRSCVRWRYTPGY